MVLALSLRAGPIGLVKPGQHPNYTVQLPQDLNNLTGITLEELLQQNPQYQFGFTSMTDTGPRNLVGYFDPVLPATWVIWTTPNLWQPPKEEPNFERLIPSPTGCEVTGTCPPPPPPGCEVTHSCPPPVCVYDCHHPVPPPTEVPEPNVFIFVSMGLILICLRQPQKHHRR